MQPLLPQWRTDDPSEQELQAAEGAGQGLEELADMFATELDQLAHEQQQQQQPPPGSASTASRRKRPRAQLVSINFGSQDGGQDHPAGACSTQQGAENVDLFTPPWLQPRTKAARKNSSPETAAHQHNDPIAPTAPQPSAAAAPAPAAGPEAAAQQGKRMQQHSRPPQRTPPAHAIPPAPTHAAAGAEQDDDIICDNSSDDFEPPSSSRRIPARARGTNAGKRPAAATGSARTPASTGAGGTKNLLDSLLGPSPGLGGSKAAVGAGQVPSRGNMQHQHQQQQQQQQFRAPASYAPEPYADAGDGCGGDAWVPPKYKQPSSTQGLVGNQAGLGASSMTQQHQQQHWQQPSSSFRPPGILERHPPAAAAAAAGGGGDFGAGAHGMQGGPAVGCGGDVSQAWWWVLPDFVPVEVLLQQQCNPRDGAPVYINYKSQFKDGGAAAAPKGRKAAAGATARQTKAKGKRGAAAAAAGPTGFMSAAWLDQQEGNGSGGRSKGRKRRSRKGKGAAGGSSGGGRRKRGSGGGRWSTVGGRKVFISNSGARLTGASAYKAYKGT